jgi:hypothetical protein
MLRDATEKQSRYCNKPIAQMPWIAHAAKWLTTLVLSRAAPNGGVWNSVGSQLCLNAASII